MLRSVSVWLLPSPRSVASTLRNCQPTHQAAASSSSTATPSSIRGSVYHFPRTTAVAAAAAAATFSAPKASASGENCFLHFSDHCASTWFCDHCGESFKEIGTTGTSAAHWTCEHDLDLCEDCHSELLETGEYELHPASLTTETEETYPRTKSGWFTITPAEWTYFQRTFTTGDSHMSKRNWLIEPCYFVRIFYVVSLLASLRVTALRLLFSQRSLGSFSVLLFFQKEGAVVLCLRVRHSTTANDVYVCSGFLEEKMLGDFQSGFFPDTSDIWRLDPLSYKSSTCCNCSTATPAVYWCTDTTCYHGICFLYYSRARFPDSPHVVWPDLDHFQVPDSGPCASCVPHKPLTPSRDSSYVLMPFLLVHILGLGKDEKHILTNDAFFKRDSCFLAGAGVYPFTIDATSLSAKASLHDRVQAICARFEGIHAVRLVINLSAHMSAAGYNVNNMTYSEEQLLDGIFRPLLRAFRTTTDRKPTHRAVIMVNVCDAVVQNWQTLLQAEPELTRFDLVVMTKPILYGDIPSVFSAFARNYTNWHLQRDPSFTVADALALSITQDFITGTSPVVLTYGHAPVDSFTLSRAARPVLLPSQSGLQLLPSACPSESESSLPGLDFFDRPLSLPTADTTLVAATAGATILPAAAGSGAPFGSAASSSAASSVTNIMHVHQLLFPPVMATASAAAAAPDAPAWSTAARNERLLSFLKERPLSVLTGMGLSGVDETTLIANLGALTTMLSRLEHASSEFWSLADATTRKKFRSWAKKHFTIVPDALVPDPRLAIYHFNHAASEPQLAALPPPDSTGTSRTSTTAAAAAAAATSAQAEYDAMADVD